MITNSNSLFRERDAPSHGRCFTSHHVRYRAVPRTNRTLTTVNTHNHSSTSSTTESPVCVPSLPWQCIGTPTRFQRGKQIGTYVGMIPCEDSSAGKQRLGHISKQGSSLLRFLLVEAAQAAARIHPDWRRRYMHLAMRRHKSSPL